MASFTFNWNQCIRESSLESTTRFVLFTLATYMDGQGYAFPGQEELAKASGLSPRSVGTHLRRAAKAGWILVKQTQRRGKKWTNNTYQATIPPTLKREAPEDNAVVADGNLMRDGEATGSTVVRNQIPTNTPNNTPMNNGVEADHSVEDAFEVLWITFPRNPASNKRAALLEWKKLTPVQRDRCLIGAANHALSVDGRQPFSSGTNGALKFVSHLSTWLRDCKWESQ